MVSANNMLCLLPFTLFALFIRPGVALSRAEVVHQGLVRRVEGDVQLFKRFSASKWSFYDVGLGACGKTNVESDFIVALNADQFGSGYPGPNCFKSIKMTYNGKTATAKIMDRCPGCPYGGLDLSRSLFRHFDSENKGIIYGEWSFSDGAAAAGPTTSTKAAAAVQPTTSTKKVTTTSNTPAAVVQPTTTTPKAAPTTTSHRIVQETKTTTQRPNVAPASTTLARVNAVELSSAPSSVTQVVPSASTSISNTNATTSSSSITSASTVASTSTQNITASLTSLSASIASASAAAASSTDIFSTEAPKMIEVISVLFYKLASLLVSVVKEEDAVAAAN